MRACVCVNVYRNLCHSALQWIETYCGVFAECATACIYLVPVDETNSFSKWVVTTHS